VLAANAIVVWEQRGRQSSLRMALLLELELEQVLEQEQEQEQQQRLTAVPPPESSEAADAALEAFVRHVPQQP